MSAAWDRIRSEPALLVGLVVAVVALVVAFGVPVSDDQKVAITGIVTAVLALAGGGAVRAQVTPTRNIAPQKVDPDATGD